MSRPVSVLVTCVGGRLIYDIIAALRAAEDLDVKVFGIDADPEAHGRLLCDEFLVVPIAENHPDEWLSAVMQLHARQPLDAILALSEGESRLLASEEDRFAAAGIKTSVSAKSIVMTMTDKLLLLQHLSADGVDTGPFHPVDTEADLDAALAALGYPERKVVLKPRQGRGSRGVLICSSEHAVFERLLPNRFCGIGDRDALLRALADENDDLDDYLATEYYGGPVSDIDCVVEQGVLKDVCVRLRQLKNPLWPTSTGHKIHMDQRVIDYVRDICASLKVDGAGDFDIVIDDTGKPKILDAAARFSGSVGGAFTAGANFPAQLIRTLLDLPRERLSVRDGTVLRPYITMASIPEFNEHDLL